MCILCKAEILSYYFSDRPKDTEPRNKNILPSRNCFDFNFLTQWDASSKMTQHEFCASWVWYIIVTDKTDPYSDPVCVWKISEELQFGHLNQTWEQNKKTQPGYQGY